MLISAALFVDVLKPASLLSLNLQAEMCDIVQGVQAILKYGKRRMTGQEPLQWPMVKLVCSRLKEEDQGKIYQCWREKNKN